MAVAAVALAFTLGGGSGGAGTPGRRSKQAGCTLTATPRCRSVHRITTPYADLAEVEHRPADVGPSLRVTGDLRDLRRAGVPGRQLVHNLEHGAIAVQYGEDVPQATIERAQELRAGPPRGTVLAPYPRSGTRSRSAHGSSPTVEAGRGNRAYLAKCTEFDETAFAAFFDAYQFQGPERFPPDSLLPGRS